MANNLDNFIPEIWSRAIQQRLDQTNLALALLANTDDEGGIRQAGDTVHGRTYGDVTMQSYVRGQSLSYEDLAPTKETMTVNEAKSFAFQVDDLDKAQNDLDALSGYTQRAAVAVANAIDSKLFGYHASALTANKISSTGSAINISHTATDDTHPYALLVKAGMALDAQNVSSEGRWAIVTPYFKSLLLKDTVYFVKGSDLGDTVLTTGKLGPARSAMNFVGQAAGFDIYWSNNLPAVASNYYCIYGQDKPVSYAAQIPPGTLEALRLESTFATAIRGLLLHDGKVFTEASKRLGTIFVDNS